MEQRKAKVEHGVDSEALLPGGPKDAGDGAILNIVFYPFPCSARVFIDADMIGAGSVTAARAIATNLRPSFLRKPPFPDPRIGDELAPPDDPPDVPPVEPKQIQLRVEVGPTTGPFRVIEWQSRFNAGSANFDVPNFTLPDDGPGEFDNTTAAAKALLPGEPITPRDVPQWTCRIINLERSPIKCRAGVFFMVLRNVDVTRIPLIRFNRIFEGGLRWLIPNVRANRGNIVVSLNEEASDTLEIAPKSIPLGGAEVTDASVAIDALHFDVLRTEDVLQEAFEDLTRYIKNLANAGVQVKVPANFVNRMVARAMLANGADLLAFADSILPNPIVQSGASATFNLAGAFKSLDIPRKLFTKTTRPIKDDLALRGR